MPLRKTEWNRMKYICNHWFSLMDFDRTGILMARKLRKLYGIHPLFFANYKFLQKLKEIDGQYKGSVLAANQCLLVLKISMI
jgi:hypothetical protein